MSKLYTVTTLTKADYQKGLTAEGDSSAGGGKHGRMYYYEKIVSFGWIEGVQRGFLLEKKGKDIPCRGAEDGKH